MGAWDALGRGIESGIGNAIRISEKRKDDEYRKNQAEQEKAYRDKMFAFNQKQHNDNISRQNLQDLYNMNDKQKDRDLRWKIANLEDGYNRFNLSLRQKEANKDDAYIDGKYNSARMTSLLNNYFKEGSTGYNWIDFANEYDPNNPEHIKIMEDAINFAVSHDASFYDEDKLRTDITGTVKQRINNLSSMDEYGARQSAIAREQAEEKARQQALKDAEFKKKEEAWKSRVNDFNNSNYVNPVQVSGATIEEREPGLLKGLMNGFNKLAGRNKKSNIASNNNGIIGNYR